MKNFWKSLMIVLVSVFALASCEDVPAPYPNPDNGNAGGDTPGEEATAITCAQAKEICAALADGTTSTETYSITGYITDVFANISNNQQSFWMSDSNDGQKMVQAYWANLPEGVSAFTVGSKVKITGKLLKYVKNGGEVITEIKNANVEILEQGGDTPGEEATAITCAKAMEICAALADGTTSTETYSITGYITDVFAKISNNQQSFWMSDNNDGQKMVQAYWANLPEGVSAFTVGSKVKITGKLLKFVNNGGEVITEIKNANVEILEQGGDTPGEEMPEPGEENPGGDTPGGDTPNEGADASFVMASAFPDCNTNTDAGTFTLAGVQFSFAKNGGNNIPKYYWNSNSSFCSVRMYALNSMTIKADKKIAKAVIHCPSPSGSTNYNGNATMTTTAGTISQASDHLSVTIDGINSDTFTLTNHHTGNSGGVQLRIVSVDLIYAD